MGAAEGPDSDRAAASLEQRGRLSNPVQRRLSDADIGELCRLYGEGRSIDSLARQYEVNRTTIITHLDRVGIERRRVAPKMTDNSVACRQGCDPLRGWHTARHNEHNNTQAESI